MTVRNIVSAAAGLSSGTAVATDAQFKNTTLLLSGDGTNGAQNNTFLDNSIPGGYGVYYAQAGVSWLKTSTSLTLSGDFTIEFWIKLDAAAVSANTYQGIFTIGDENAAGSTGLAVFGYSNGSSLYVGNNIATGQSVAKGSLGIWSHVAVVRSGSTVKIALNGDMTGAGTITGWSATISGTVTIGGEFYNGNVGWAMSRGALSNVRIVNGTALYTANFTPPVAPLTAISGTQLLVCQSSTLFLDNSPLQATNTSNNLVGLSVISPSNYGMAITRAGSTTQGSFSPYGDLWSNYFDGSSSIYTADNAAYTFGTNNFTIEAWIYPTSLDSGGFTFIVGQGNSGLSGGSVLLYLDSSGGLGAFLWVGSTAYGVNTTTAVPLNTWSHVAAVRDGSITRLYIDGVQRGVPAFLSQINSRSVTDYAGNFYVGRGGDYTSGQFRGYISNVRVVNGTCLYPNGTTFTPSTTPLTAITNTSLLTCQNNRFKDNSSNSFAVSTTGTPTVERFNAFKPSAEYTTGVIGSSAYFDGSSSLSTPANATLTMGTSDFTVEFWMYATNAADLGTAATIVRIRANAATTWNMQLNSGQMQFYGGGAAAGDPSSIPLNTWIHFAGVRTGGNLFSLYRNGVLVSTLSSTTNLTASDTLLVGVGGDSSDTAYPFYGYIADLRIVKGTALYTANFTPPTAPLTPTINTSLLMSYSNAGIYDAAVLNDLTTVGDAKVSTAQAKWGGSSMAFDGTGDYLSTPTSPGMNFGTGDFTVEAWVYPTALASDWFISSASGSGGFFFGFSSTTVVGYGWGRAGVAWDYRVASTATANTWQHVAVTRSGSSMRLFVNGVQQGTTQTISTAYNMGTTSTTVGSQGANYYFTGYLEDVRVTKGYARYTANFTPPTTALPKR